MPVPLAIVVLAAGKGTRMKSSIPKVLHKIAGKTLLSHVLTTAKNVNPDKILLVVGYESEQISAAGLKFAQDNNFSLNIVTQEKPAGTGDAVACALKTIPDFEGNIVVLSADVPLLDAPAVQGLIDHQMESPAAVATMLTTDLQNPTGYGRVIRTADGTVSKIVEHKDATQKELDIKEINSGIYVFKADFLKNSLPLLNTNNSQNEFYLTDTISIARKQGKIVLGKHIEDSVLVTGCNDRWQLSQLAIIANQRILKKHMLAGVSIIDPQNTWIDTEVKIGVDTTIQPGTQIAGNTVIGAKNLIGPDTTIENSLIGDGNHIVRSHILEAKIENDTKIGPFSYLRPGSHLDNQSKVGAYVESKNSYVGTGSKVPHLSYIGDVEIGEETNFGAGTIIANYDGVNKHQSTVGNNVKLGANTVLVSPVNIPDNVYTGAGTIITKDLPSDSLAVPESKFRIIKNWVSKNRGLKRKK